MKQVAIGFGILIFCLLVLFQLARLQSYRTEFRIEIWITVFSLVFFAIGVVLSRKLRHTRQTATVDDELYSIPGKPFEADALQIAKLKISKREYEILVLINEGLSNLQIAEKLFVSENTVKKHVSNLFFKMNVERRTEALRKAKGLKILT